MINRLGQLEKSIILLYLEEKKLRKKLPENHRADFDKTLPPKLSPHQGQN